MAFKIHVLIIALLAGSGHLAPNLENIAEIGEEFANALVNNPIAQQVSSGMTNSFATFLNAFTGIPLSTAAAFKNIAFPSMVNPKNIAELVSSVADFNAAPKNKDAVLHTGQLIKKYGFPMEHHNVTTEDGYILSMFRIPSDGPSVFLMHGLLSSSAEWVLNGPEQGLAYLLSKAGYDVWMGNARGNRYSRRHLKYTTSQAAFWDFSWHEIGVHDVPAMIDYILDTTGEDTLKYVGFSQGTTSFYVMCSERPEYNDKISLMVSLSPVAFMSHLLSPFMRLLSIPGPVFEVLYKLVGVHEFLPDIAMIRNLKIMICGTGSVAEAFCNNVLSLIVGPSVEHLDVKKLPVIFGHLPAGASTKQLLHYAQGIVSGEFRQYSYGAIENRRRYGSDESPAYNLRKVTVPVALFYSGNGDWMSHPTDVQKLSTKLRNVVDMYKLSGFNHLDFVWAKDFKKYIYLRLKRIFDKFE